MQQYKLVYIIDTTNTYTLTKSRKVSCYVTDFPNKAAILDARFPPSSIGTATLKVIPPNIHFLYSNKLIFPISFPFLNTIKQYETSNMNRLHATIAVAAVFLKYI